MLTIIADYPRSTRTRHDIQVVKIVAVRGTNGMVSTRHQYDVTIPNTQSLIEIAFVGIDTLKPKALAGLEAMVVGLFERCFLSRSCRIVFVRGITRPMPPGCNHFND